MNFNPNSKCRLLARLMVCVGLTVMALPHAQATSVAAGRYTIRIAHSDKCVTVPGGSVSDSIQLQQSTCGTATYQQWDVSATDSGYYKIINVNSGKAIDLRNGSTSDGAVIQQYTWTNSYNQHYLFQSNGDGYVLRNRTSGKCVDQQNSSPSDGGVLQQLGCSGAPNQTYILTPTSTANMTVANGRYTVTNLNSNKCLDVPSSSTANSVQLQQYTCNGTAAQQYDFVYVGNSQYEIVNANSGKCVDVSGSSTLNGTWVQQYTCNHGTNQRFYASGVGDGSFWLKTALNGTSVVDVSGASTADGAKTILYNNTGGNNQKWRLTPVAYGPNIADGTYTIKVVDSSKCLDVPSSNVNPGIQLHEYSCNSTTAQQFVVTHQADGYYKIVNVNSGLGFSVRDFSASSGAAIEQQNQYSGDNQLFRFVAYGSGYLIRPKSTYMCADVNRGTSPGMLNQYTCNYGNNQVFQFTQLSGATTYGSGAARNTDTIVLLHGFAGWGRDELFGLKYWGGGWSGKGDLQEYLKSLGYNVVTLSVGPISSNWDRAVEAYYQLKGGCVDYGATHSSTYGHKEAGRCYTALLTNWDDTHKIHIIAHSQGGQTARVLLKLLRDGKTGEGSAPIFQGGKNWIRSITTLSTPHDGTTLTAFVNPLGITEKIVTAAYRLGGLVSGDGAIYDLKLDQWSLTRNPGESWYDYNTRVTNNATWRNTLDNSLYDLSPDGASKIYGGNITYPDVYYFSLTTRSTYKGFWDGKQHALLSTFTPFIPQSEYMGQYTRNETGHTVIDSSWWANDSVVNSRSMAAPSGAPKQAYNGTPVKGVWQDLGTWDGWDHLDIIGDFTLKDASTFYVNHAKLLYWLN
ncbi:MAG TPA: RICIN domain-containing protein [Aquabacterium sp.]|nr:RICIN domain-containing protein [Aquabacterium sp.]